MSEFQPALKPPAPSRQVAFHQLLQAARKEWLVDGLQEALAEIPASRLRRQIGSMVPDDVAAILATAGIREEYVFPTPIVLETKPTLLGYYRLILGTSQKAFYRAGTGLGRFKSMEMRGVLTEAQKPDLPNLCAALASPLSDLIRQMSPTATSRDISELPLLTLGAQFQGSNNVSIGKKATEAVFLAIRELVEDHLEHQTETRLVVKNAAGRRVVIALSGDPDVRIQEEFDGSLRNRVAIEIKGGTDQSNVHNRAGEAEKSHRKAKEDDYRDYWTIILKRGVSQGRLEEESPTTNSWFDISELLARTGQDWDHFRSRLAGEVGIPLL